MKHCRSDYQAIQPFPTRRPHIVKINGETVDAGSVEYLGSRMDPIIPDDEPVFLLRAKDVTAPGVVRYWAKLQELLRGSDPAMASAAWKFADEMEQYAIEHYDGGKIADAPAAALDR